MSKLEREKKWRDTVKPVKSGAALSTGHTYKTSDGKGFEIVDRGNLKAVQQRGVGIGKSGQRAVVDSRVKVFVRGNTIYTGNYGKNSKKVGTLVDTPRWNYDSAPSKKSVKKGGKK